MSDTQLDGLVAVVSVAVALGASPAALWADRWSRVRAIAVMGTVWSLAAAACGVARRYRQLLVARAAVGVGEAGYGPAAWALLATMFPSARRATVFRAFQAAGPLGAGRGGWRGGRGALRVAGRRSDSSRCPGWRWLCCSSASGTIRRCGWQDCAARGSARRILHELCRARSGMAGYTRGAVPLMVVSTVYTWLPSQFLRVSGMPVDRAAGAMGRVMLAGFAGMIAFAHVADLAARRSLRARLLVPAVITAGLLSAAFAAVGPGPPSSC